MKKAVSRLGFAFFLMVSCMASALTESVNGLTWTYTISGGKASVGSGNYDGNRAIPTSTTGTIAIPSTLGGSPVTSIGDYAFYLCSGLTSVTIPDSVTNIGSHAFYNCSGLTAVTIPDSVMGIGSSSFSYCSGLTSITVNAHNPNYSSTNGLLLTKDGKSLIEGINGDVTIPESVTTIGNYAFYGRSGLTSVTIPDSVMSIGASSFSSCRGLTSVTIPDSVTSIGNYAFKCCHGLTSVTIGNSVTRIGDYAFIECLGLTSVTIPGSVTHLGNSAFENCRGLTSVTIPSSVTSLGMKVFRFCTGLTSVTIPDSVTSIGQDAFRNCSGIRDIAVPGRFKMSAIFPNSYQSITNAVIAGGVTNIASSAFSNCTDLTSVTIPDSVTSIGDYAFYNCSGLTSVTIPDSVKTIAKQVFHDCESLSLLRLPKGFEGNTADMGIPDVCKVFFGGTVFSGEVAVSGGMPVQLFCGDSAPWFKVSDATTEDGHCIRSGEIGAGETSSVEVTLTGPGTLSFKWKVPAGRGDHAKAYLNDVEQMSINRRTTWQNASIGIPAGEHIVRWSYERGSGSASGEDATFLDNVCWQPFSLEDVLDAGNVVWTIDGAAAWFPQTSVSNDGTDAARSGEVSGDDFSGLETTLAGPGTLSWFWRLDSSVDGNSGVDVLLDGVWLDAYEPTGEWTEELLEVGAGEHTIRFEFWNAGTAATITDCAYIDQVVWTPESVEVDGVEVPVSWLDEFPTLVEKHGGSHETAANATAANVVNKVWECYVAGISPTNAAAAFRAVISWENGAPEISWDPILTPEEAAKRTYRKYGKKSLTDPNEVWTEINGDEASYNFFKVSVEMTK